MSHIPMCISTGRRSDSRRRRTGTTQTHLRAPSRSPTGAIRATRGAVQRNGEPVVMSRMGPVVRVVRESANQLATRKRRTHLCACVHQNKVATTLPSSQHFPNGRRHRKKGWGGDVSRDSNLHGCWSIEDGCRSNSRRARSTRVYICLYTDLPPRVSPVLALVVAPNDTGLYCHCYIHPKPSPRA